MGRSVYFYRRLTLLLFVAVLALTLAMRAATADVGSVDPASSKDAQYGSEAVSQDESEYRPAPIGEGATCTADRTSITCDLVGGY